MYLVYQSPFFTFHLIYKSIMLASRTTKTFITINSDLIFMFVLYSFSYNHTSFCLSRQTQWACGYSLLRRKV